MMNSPFKTKGSCARLTFRVHSVLVLAAMTEPKHGYSPYTRVRGQKSMLRETRDLVLAKEPSKISDLNAL